MQNVVGFRWTGLQGREFSARHSRSDISRPGGMPTATKCSRLSPSGWRHRCVGSPPVRSRRNRIAVRRLRRFQVSESVIEDLIGQAIARRVGVGKTVVLAYRSEADANAADLAEVRAQ